jgi:hypothetical protein
MEAWCWLGSFLFLLCLCGIVLAVGVLIFLLVRWLRPRPIVRPVSQTVVEGAVKAAAPDEGMEPTPAEPVPEPLPPPLEPTPVETPYTTYENAVTMHVTIHRTGCKMIQKSSGERRFGQEGYKGHASFDAATDYASTTGLPVQHCKVCDPKPRQG